MVRKSKLWVYILVSIIAIAIVIAIIFGIYLTKNISYASEGQAKTIAVEIPITPRDKSKEINIDEIVNNNTQTQKKEVLENTFEILEYHYKILDALSIENKIIILHVGSSVLGKQNSIKRFINNF